MATKKPRTVKKQAEEAEKIQKGLIDAQNSPDGETSKDKDELQAKLSLVDDPPPAPPADTADPENWEGRFKGLKATHDQTVFELRQQLNDAVGNFETATNQISTLTGEVEKLRKTDDEPSAAEQAKIEVTDAEREEYGEGLIDLIQKVSGGTTAKEVDLAKQVLDLQNRLESITNKQEQVAETQVKDKRTEFFGELDSEVEGWRVINKDPKFHKWLATEMPGTGEERQFYLQKHFKNYDVSQVSKLFNEFLGAAGPSGTTQDDLEEQVLSSGSNASVVDTSVDTKGKIWTRSEIKQFYEDKRKGKYKHEPEEARRMEKDIHAATIEGRVRD